MTDDERIERHLTDMAAMKTAAREERITFIGAVALLLFLLLFALSGCGFGQLGPETLITADTPCGRIEYRSTKDQAQPNAVCSIGRDGEALFEVGSAAASGAGVVAQSVAGAVLGAVKAAGGW